MGTTPKRNKLKSMTNADYLADKESVLSAFDKALGTNSQEIIRSQSVKRNATKQSQRPTSLGIVKGVSKMFKQNADIDNYKSFMYVSPSSTQKEKMYSIRTKLISNYKGLVVHDEERRSPPKNFVDKILNDRKKHKFEASLRKSQ